MDESNIYEMNYGEQYFEIFIFIKNPELKKMNEAPMQQILQIVLWKFQECMYPLENEDRLFYGIFYT